MPHSPKERILETASILFHQQGYNNTGINQIIAEAKVSKASFYDHFPSKEDLCIAFLNKRYDYWSSEWEKFTSGAHTPREKVFQSFDFLMYMNEKENYRGCSFLNISSEIPDEKAEIHSVIREHKSKIRYFFSNEIPDEALSDTVYLLFESSIVTGRLFRNNELTKKAQAIAGDLFKA